MAKVLVIAPHADDEALGCGGTIIKHKKAGDQVAVCIVTKPHSPDWSQEYIDNRIKEIQKAKEVLGVDQTFQLDFKAAQIDSVAHKDLNKAIGEVVAEFNPEIIYVPYGKDLHRDHQLVFQSCLVACRYRLGKILAYETVSETDIFPVFTKFFPNTYIDISEEIQGKLEAMKSYSSEVKQWPHPRSLEAIKISAQKRGSEAGLDYAEAIVLIKSTTKSL